MSNEWSVEDKVLPEYQFLFSQDFLFDKRFSGVMNIMGSKRSSKSWTGGHLAVFLQNVLDCNILAMRKVFDDIRGSVFKEIIQAIDDMHLNHMYKISSAPMEITNLKTGAQFIFKGMNAGAAGSNMGGQRLGSFNFIKRKEYIFTWLEEAYEFTDEDISFVVASLPGAKKVWILKTLNPWDETRKITRDLNRVLNPTLEHMQKYHFKRGFDTNGDLYMTTNYLLNKKNLSDLLIQEMEQKAINQPKAALAFVWGLVGVTGDITYESLDEKLIIDEVPEWVKQYRGGVDVGMKHDDTAFTFEGLSNMSDKTILLETYSYSNDTSPIKKTITDYVDDFFDFWIANAEIEPSLMYRGVFIYVDRANNEFYQLLKNETFRRIYKGVVMAKWMRIRESKKPLIVKRVQAENYLMATESMFWLRTSRHKRKLPDYFNRNMLNYLEFKNSKKELKAIKNVTEGYTGRWIRSDGEDNTLNAREYSWSKDWPKLTKGAMIEWKNTDTDMD